MNEEPVFFIAVSESRVYLQKKTKVILNDDFN
jgi:hypothetical protein